MVRDVHNVDDSSSGPSGSTENNYDAASPSTSNPPSEGTYLNRGRQTYFDDEKVLIPEDDTVSIYLNFKFLSALIYCLMARA